MTIKKIGLSALTAATLVTGAFAATTLTSDFFTDTATSGVADLTYNSKYTKNVEDGVDFNPGLGTDLKFTGVGLNTDYTIEIALTGAAFRVDSTQELGLYKEGTTLVSILPSYSEDNSTITFTINAEGVDAADTINLGYASGDLTNDIYIPKGTSGNISAKLIARKDNNNKSQISTATRPMATQKDQEVSAQIECGPNDGNIGDFKIDPVVRKTFVYGDDDNVTSLKCILTTKRPTTQATYDFNYEDINATVVFDGGNFSDGGFISSGGAVKEEDNKTLFIAGPLDGWVFDANTTILTYVLNYPLDTTLKSVDFSASVTLGHEASKQSSYPSPNSIKAAKSQLKTMVWDLNTYLANIINVRHNDATGLRSMITIYNSSEKDANIVVNALNGDGAGNSIPVVIADPLIKSGTSKMLVTGTADLPSTLENGYTLEISMDINKDFGEVIANQRTDTSKTILKVKDDNSDR